MKVGALAILSALAFLAAPGPARAERAWFFRLDLPLGSWEYAPNIDAHDQTFAEESWDPGVALGVDYDPGVGGFGVDVFLQALTSRFGRVKGISLCYLLPHRPDAWLAQRLKVAALWADFNDEGTVEATNQLGVQGGWSAEVRGRSRVWVPFYVDVLYRYLRPKNTLDESWGVPDSLNLSALVVNAGFRLRF